MDARGVEAALLQAWARQLQDEFGQICFQYSLHLVHPVIEIIESTEILGRWQRHTRTIGISRHIVVNHGWDVTINALKHEMAHQICDEVFGCQGAPHDDRFRQACVMLGLPEGFSRARLDPACFHAPMAAATSGDDRRRKLIERVRKVLALSQSANEHEARLALETAVRLMNRHDLERDEIESPLNEVTYRIVSLARQRVHLYQRLIASLLSRHFNVRLIHSRIYDPEVDVVYRSFEILGRRDNVEIAEYCYHFLENRLAALWSAHRKGLSGMARGLKNSYYCGVLQGFEQNLTRNRKEEKGGEGGKAGSRDLDEVQSHLVVGDREVEALVARRHPRLQKQGGRKTRVNPTLFSQGIDAGREITLRTGIREGATDGCGPNLLSEH
ncbi:DUF2786 domain-containing protein [Desulfoprunum benzoelyticum]|uniref:DUF2786 domain-containing protein n=1 Tax=Desulfoprunum benzoelyticum TaxID=1506996 RepID=A0A840UY99_9BACT|nr:DUF2786 domain-containing protein [Desulfoprunum benzoelyticum]MBB5346439.1 hypothetical protein [Desulfoprunum benzoelyticum]MBM9528563.1 DUF2786 domain-containing protein [Desulfoprunum benzoelyticum]